MRETESIKGEVFKEEKLEKRWILRWWSLPSFLPPSLSLSYLLLPIFSSVCEFLSLSLSLSYSFHLLSPIVWLLISFLTFFGNISVFSIFLLFAYHSSYIFVHQSTSSSIPLFLFLSLYVFVYHSMSFTITLSLCLSLYVFIYHSMSFTITLSLFLSLSVFIYHSMSLSITLCLCLSLYVFVGI